MTKHSRSGSRKSKSTSVKRYKTPGTRVEVVWEDAYKESRWNHDPLEHEPFLVDNLGYVLFHDARGIMLCDSKIRGVDSVGGRHFIPSGMVRGIKEIKK
jgi:hypothetical protein